MIQLNFPNAVRDEKDFYGQKRKADLDRIEVRFLSENSLSAVVVGERRIGKTSIQNVAMRRLKKVSNRRFVPLQVEPSGITTLEGLSQAILRRLAVYLKRDLHRTGLVNADGRFSLETVDQFEVGFASLLGQSSEDIFILCVDEFDEIIRNVGDDLPKIMGLINIFIEKKTAIPLLLFFTMTRLPENPKAEEPSPLISRTELVELKPFAQPDIERMVQGILADQMVLNEAGLDWLYRISGGHPYFTKLLLANLIEQQCHQRTTLIVTQDMLEQTLQRAVTDPRANVAIENIYRVHFDANEKRIALLLADTQKPVTADALEKADVKFLTAARSLAQRNYLCEQKGKFDFHIAFLGHWLRNWREFQEGIERFHTRRILDPWAGSRPTVVTNDDSWRYGLSSE